ncbi:hypothetical protein INS49_015498 [Diaporthe citri]|uniref:uncharacterized protein n=1 Tax=Diaporthe citri TaxID=83186 RepID=UPI001C7F7D34|nr:uncharacterized protein INS49_015498 [Diaporthe citri]KAG6356113.1 hypothetical protein INS49_015498 [Diaporthe citri]
MTSTTHEQKSRLDDLSMPFEPDLNDDFYSEFLDFGPGNNAFFETLLDPSEPLLNSLPPIDLDNAMNASGVQPSATGCNLACLKEVSDCSSIPFPTGSLTTMIHNSSREFCQY